MLEIRKPVLYNTQQGGTIVSDVAKLSIPLGLILSHDGLAKLMSRSKESSIHASKTMSIASRNKLRSRAALSGGSPSLASSKKEGGDKRSHQNKRKAPQSRSLKSTQADQIKRKQDRDTTIRDHFIQIAHRVQGIFAKARVVTKDDSKHAVIRANTESPTRIKQHIITRKHTDTLSQSKPKAKPITKNKEDMNGKEKKKLKLKLKMKTDSKSQLKTSSHHRSGTKTKVKTKV